MKQVALVLWLITSLAIYGLLVPLPVHAGHPACDPHQPKRAPCDKSSCTQMDKDGKPNGNKCSSYCTKGCCGCGTECTVDYPGQGQNPDDVLMVGLKSGRVD